MQWLLVVLGALPAFHLDEAAIAGPEGTVSLDFPWHYHPGDDPAWAEPGTDDSDWMEVSPFLAPDDRFPGEWIGAAWFRTRIDVAPELTRRPLALWASIHGATEIYLDGRAIYRRGLIEDGHAVPPEPLVMDARVPIIFSIAEPGSHLLALRYATESLGYAQQVGFFRGTDLEIGEPERSIEFRSRRELEFHGLHEFFTGAALVLATLHLLIFLFTRRRPENLYFALATLSVTGIATFSRQWSFVEEMEKARMMTTLFKISLICTVVFSLSFYYQVFMRRLPRYFWLVAGLGALMAVGSYWLSFRVVYIFASLTFLEPARVLFKAMLDKKEDAWIIVVGGALSIAAGLAQMLPLILKEEGGRRPNAVYLYGFLALLLSMSIYLARRIARMNQRLRDQLNQVRELSTLTLVQERRSKEELLERERLEAENVRKEIELEAGKKREAVLAELQAAHEDLKHAQAKLVQSEKMASLGQLVAGVAHEINTPVGAIHSMRDSLAKAVERMRGDLEKNHPEILHEPAVKRSMAVLQDGLRVIESGSMRVTGIVKRLKTFARLDEADLQLTDIHAGIEDTLVLLQHELKKGIELEKDFGVLPKISCYPGQLNQVFLNLLVNATHAIEAQGKITVQTRAEDTHAVVRISDNGSGIPSEVLPRIFDPGFTTKGVGVGTGLGLSICYRIINDHNGDIAVESEVGRGTTFTIRLPIAQTSP